jgi:hypothetical protein
MPAQIIHGERVAPELREGRERVIHEGLRPVGRGVVLEVFG